LYDDACSNDNLRGLGLQRIVVGLSARLKSSGAVQCQKTTRATPSFSKIDGGDLRDRETTS
jgi:hypothetical protein